MFRRIRIDLGNVPIFMQAPLSSSIFNWARRRCRVETSSPKNRIFVGSEIEGVGMVRSSGDRERERGVSWAPIEWFTVENSRQGNVQRDPYYGFLSTFQFSPVESLKNVLYITSKCIFGGQLRDFCPYVWCRRREPVDVIVFLDFSKGGMRRIWIIVCLCFLWLKIFRKFYLYGRGCL